MNHSNTMWVAALLLAGGAVAHADSAGGEGSNRFELGVVEVTGNRDEAALDHPGVERITQEDMRRHERYDATEAVNLLPGIHVENIGNRNERVVFIRGFDSRQIPLFVDGIPVYVPYNGSIDLARFTTFDVSEIHVTKGFTSVLYGPNTLGGSINLVSKRPTDAFEGDFVAGLGFDDNWAQNVYRLAANVGSNQGNWYFQAGASVLDRDHFRVSDDFTPGAAEDGGRRDNSDIEDTKYSFKVGWTPNDTDEYALSYYKQESTKGVPPYGGQFNIRPRFWRWPYYDKESLYFLSRTAFGNGHYVRVRAYYDEFDNLLQAFDDNTYTTQNRPSSFNSTYDDHSWGGGVEFGFAVAPQHLLKVAASLKKDFHEEQDNDNEPWEKFEDETWSVAAEDTWTVSDATTVIAGVSWNRQEAKRADQKLPDGSIVPFDTGSDSTWNAQLGWFHALNESTDLRASVGRKTRFPTISNRYSGRFGSALPNPDLEAEYSTNYEIGFDRRQGSVSYGAALFLSQLDDAIQSVTIAPDQCLSPPCSQAQNIEEQENKGVELYVRFDLLKDLFLHVDYTYLDRENKTRSDVKPIDTPDHKVFGYLVYTPIPSLELVASVIYEGSRLNESPGVREADAFTVANLKGSWDWRNGLVTEFGINNVFDEDYAYDEGFPEPGRNFFLNVQYRY
jgi:iron complex outermembrane recepter protein